jgi:hypothetical protein
MNKYKAIYEATNGMIGTWASEDIDADAFIANFLKMERMLNHVKKFIKVYQQCVINGKYSEKHKMVKKYNWLLETIKEINENS